MNEKAVAAKPGSAVEPGHKEGFIPRNVHPYAWATLGVTWLIWAFNAMDFAFVQILGPSIVKEFGITGVTYGSILAGMFLLRAIVDLPVSSLSDHVGSGWRRKFVWAPIVVVYALVSTVTAIRAFSSTLASFFALRTIVNLGGVACESLGVTATAEWWARNHRGFAVGVHHTGFPLGILLAGQIVSGVLAWYGDENWRHVFWFSLLSLPAVAVYWWLATSRKQAAVITRIEENGLVPPVTDEHHGAAVGPWWEVLNREVVLASLYVGLFIAVLFSFLTAFPLYLAFVGGYSFSQVASYSVVWTISGAIFQILLPTISDRIGRKPILVFLGFYAAVVLLLLPYASNIYMVFAVQILFGVVTNSIYPICFAVCADAAPKNRVATAVSVCFVSLWFFSAIATFLTGVFLEAGGGFDSKAGYVTLFYLMSGLSLLAGVLYLFARETIVDPEDKAVAP